MRRLLLAIILFLASPASIHAGVWNRLGVVLNSLTVSEEEATVLYTTTDCIIISNPCFQLWTSSSGVKYRESANGLSWSAAQTALATGHQMAVVKSGSTYYMSVSNPGNTQIDLFSSSSPIGFTLLHAAIISIGTAGQWDDIAVYNTSLVIEGTMGSGGTAYIVYEAKGGVADTGAFTCGGASTQTLASTWTKSTNNPLSGAGGWCAHPDLHKIGSTWYVWAQGFTNFIQLQRFHSTTFDSLWTKDAAVMFEGTTIDEAGQVADNFMTEINGVCYLYYTGVSSGGRTAGVLKLAVANMTKAQLVTTNEGAVPQSSLLLGGASVSGGAQVQ